MNEPSAESALGQVPGDVNVSLPLGSTDREFIHLAEDSEAGVPWTVVRLCGSMESIETMEDVLEITGEMMSLTPRDCVWVAIDDEEEILKILRNNEAQANEGAPHLFTQSRGSEIRHRKLEKKELE
jgi:hypothetical protein